MSHTYAHIQAFLTLQPDYREFPDDLFAAELAAYLRRTDHVDWRKEQSLDIAQQYAAAMQLVYVHDDGEFDKAADAMLRMSDEFQVMIMQRNKPLLLWLIVHRKVLL